MALLDWAKFYVSKGLSVIPLEYKAKEPISKWKEYQQRLPTEEELEQWFKTAWRNIAIVCGQVSGNLVVLDFDSHESLQQFIEKVSDDLVKKIKKTWVVRTGKGFHIYLRVKSKPISTSFRDVGLDIQGEGKYVVAPPSLHPSGKLYSFINDPKKYDIVVLEEHEFEEILRLFKPKEGSNGELQKLTPLQKDQIVKLLLPYWDEGRRHFLSLMLAGALYWHNYPKEDAIATIEEICQKAKDDEVKDRIRAVEDTYSRADKANIAYRTWLQEAGIRGDEYEKLVFQLLDIIKGSFIVGNGKLAVRKSHNTLIVADFNKCIIKELRVKKDNTIVLADTIATAVPNKVVVIQTEDSEILKVSFRTPEGFVLTFEGDVEEISSQLKKNTVRVTARRKIEDALSLVISKMIQIGWCDVVRGECVKGLVLNDGKVVAIDYDISVPDPTQLRDALETLNKFVDMSKFSKERLGKIAKIVKWFTVSGLGWIYKQLGYWLPHLYLYGESDTGKSKTGQFLSNIWEEQPSLSLGSIDSPYRLGLALSHTTFPIIVNEMDFEALDSEVLELWKNAVDSQTLRSRYGRKVKAYGVFCFTSNTSIPSNKAIQKRLVIIHFDPKDAETLKKNEKEFEVLDVERKKLSPIGRFVANWVNGHIEDLKQYTWEALAERILKSAYEYAGLEVPDWLSMTDLEEQDEDVKTSKAEEIRAFIFTKLVPYVKERFEESDAHVLFTEISKKIPWIVYRPRENDVVLLKPLLKELKKEDIKVSSLRDLVYYIPNSEYKAKLWVEGRVLSGVIVNPVEFGKWLGFVVSAEGEGFEEEYESWNLDEVFGLGSGE